VAYLEKNFQTEFTKWARNRYEGTAAFELKLARGTSLPFSALEEHQKNALLGVKNAQIGFKIPDTGYTNPFDFFTLAGVPAFVVVQFSDPTARTHPKDFYLIDIDAWCKEEETSERKSITIEQAKKIGTLGVLA
jgi:penicillin-binding protein-related factor A (putative recombinase)